MLGAWSVLLLKNGMLLKTEYFPKQTFHEAARYLCQNKEGWGWGLNARGGGGGGA